MKKRLWFLVCMGILMFLLIAGIEVAKAEPEESRQAAETQGNLGTIYIGENREKDYLIYQVNTENQLINIFSEYKHPAGGAKYVVDLCFEDGLYMLLRQEGADGRAQYLMRRLNSELEAEEDEYAIDLNGQTGVSIYKEENKLMVRALSQDYQTEHLYRIEHKEEGIQCKKISSGDYLPQIELLQQEYPQKTGLESSFYIKFQLAVKSIAGTFLIVGIAVLTAGCLMVIGSEKKHWMFCRFLTLFCIFLFSLPAVYKAFYDRAAENIRRERLAYLRHRAETFIDLSKTGEVDFERFTELQKKYRNLARMDFVELSATGYTIMMSSNEKQAQADGGRYSNKLGQRLSEAYWEKREGYGTAIQNGMTKDYFIIQGAGKEAFDYVMVIHTDPVQLPVGQGQRMTEPQRWFFTVCILGTALIWMGCFYLGSGMKKTIRQIEEEAIQNSKNLKYGQSLLFQAYYSFAPKKAEIILEKDSILDVKRGDSILVKGTLAVLPMNRNKLPVDSNLIAQYTAECEAIGRGQKEKDGILFTNSCNLSMLKLFFSSSSDAFAFSLELMGMPEEKNGFYAGNKIMLLHTDEYFYGITGTEEQAFPFILSEQLDSLETYAEALRELGLKLVLTESVVNDITEQRMLRYIGYIRLQGLKRDMKLYEALDVYNEKLRRQKIRTNEMFQKALSLYYQNDFYLSRNNFSEVIKECGEDKVAKWYLFSCEKRLDEGEQSGFSYALFAE